MQSCSPPHVFMGPHINALVADELGCRYVCSLKSASIFKLGCFQLKCLQPGEGGMLHIEAPSPQTEKQGCPTWIAVLLTIPSWDSSRDSHQITVLHCLAASYNQTIRQ